MGGNVTVGPIYLKQFELGSFFEENGMVQDITCICVYHKEQGIHSLPNF